MENNKFCPLPWISSNIRNNGDIRVCCHANAGVSKGIFRKDDGSAYNAQSDDYVEAMNSKLAKDIRLSMLDNSTHEACTRCDREDAAGVRSRRLYETQNWEGRFGLTDAIAATETDGAIDIMPQYYDLRFGNLCNLKCRMCGPTDSSQWYDDQVKVWDMESFHDSHGKVQLVKNNKGRYEPLQNQYNWHNSDTFWKQIEDRIPSIRHIHTVGGEPLLIDRHYDLFQKIIDAGRAQDVIIEYNSNITNIPQRAWDIWKHFKTVKIGASIDAFGKANDYIRHPSKFSMLEKNLQKLDDSPDNVQAWISCTVQAYNVMNLPEFMQWILKQNYKKVQRFEFKPIITTHPLHNPRHLNIRIFPQDVKDKIAAYWRSTYSEFDRIADSQYDNEWATIVKADARKVLEGYIDFMMAEDWSDAFPKFCKYTKRLDTIRNEDMQLNLPRLYELIQTDMENA